MTTRFVTAQRLAQWGGSIFAPVALRQRGGRSWKWPTVATAWTRPRPNVSSSRSSRRAAGGTGLGLFISRELCQTNGGMLLYEPRDGGGSIFRIIFADPRRWED